MPFQSEKYAAFDVETRGIHDTRHALQPYRLRRREAEITSSALAWVQDGALKTSAIRYPAACHHRDMLEWAIREDITLVGWNMSFDAAWLCAQGLSDLVMQAKWLDGMLLWQHLEREPEYEMAATKRRSWSLKAAVAEYFPEHASYEEGIDFDDMSEEMVRKRLRYNRMDVAFTLKLAQIFYNKLEAQSRQQLRNALIEADAIAPVAVRTCEGLLVDTTAASDLAETLEETRLEALAKLNDLHRADGREDYITPAVLASPKQLSELVFDTWGLPVMKRTDKGAPSTDKESLYMLGALDERAPLIQEHREAQGNRKKFVTNILNSVEYNGDGRTRPNMRIYGTYTGRATFTSSQDKNKAKVQTGFAIHQMKNAPEFRRLITAPPGYVVVEWDAASQEYRWMAIESGDEVMLSLCMPGEDPHSFMGARIGHEDYHWLMEHKDSDSDAKKMRKAGKVGNLSCLAGDTEILTAEGVKPILLVRPDDRVWDGHDFVSHGGVVFNGYREVITYSGLTATPDHKVLCRGEWVSFGFAAARGWAIDSAGWEVGNSRRGDSQARQPSKDSLPLRVRNGKVRDTAMAGKRSKHTMQGVCEQSDSRKTRASGCVLEGNLAATETSKQHDVSLRQPRGRVVQELRSTRSGVPVRVREGSGGLHTNHNAERQLCWAGHRSEGQQRALRAWESTTGYSERQSAEHATNEHGAVERSLNTCSRVAGEAVCTHHHNAVRSTRSDRRRDTGAGVEGSGREAKGVEATKRKVAVYDILNCGPRNQFGANGLIVHNCQYRIGYKTLRIRANVNHGMPIDDKEAKVIHRTYHSTYTGVQRYWNRQIRKCKERGYAETLAGRRVQLKGQWTHRQMGWKLESTAVNFPIQGIGADQKYLAIKLLKNVLPQVGGHFYFELHDGLYAILPEKTAMRDGLKIRHMLSNMPYQKAWGFTPPIPLPWDMKIGTNWGDMKEVSE